MRLTNQSVALLCVFFFAGLASGQTRKSVSPSASEIQLALSNEGISLKNALAAITNNPSHALYNDLVTGKIKFKIDMDTSVQPRKVRLTLVPATDGSGIAISSSSSDNPLGAYLADAAGINYPWPGATPPTDTKAIDWIQKDAVKLLAGVAEQASDGGCVPANISAFNGDVISKVRTYCDAEMAKVPASKEFWFDVLPLHLQCQFISPPNLNSYSTALRLGGICPSSSAVVSETDWRLYRAKIMGEIAVGAIIYEAEKKIASDGAYMKNKARCFPVGRPFNETVLGSMAVPYKFQVNNHMKFSDVGSMSMPEPNYALGAAGQYYSDPTRAVFNNTATAAAAATGAASAVTDQFPKIKIDNQTYKTFYYDDGGSLMFSFNVRGLQSGAGGAQCTWFCGRDPIPMRTRATSLPQLDFERRLLPLRDPSS